MKCIVCGKEHDSYICNDCLANIDLFNLCMDVALYDPKMGDNELWNSIAQELDSIYFFNKTVVYDLTKDMDSEDKNYLRIQSLAKNYKGVNKAQRDELYQLVDVCLNSQKFSELEKSKLYGLLLAAYVGDYRYDDGEDIASILVEMEKNACLAYYNLIDFYSTTRRYKTAMDLITEASNHYDRSEFSDIESKNNKRYEAFQIGGKGQYMPNPRDKKEKEKAIDAYLSFLSNLGIEVVKKSSVTPIRRSDYPELKHIFEAGFDSFVAYDFETTGFSDKKDSPIEIGAIKVINGKIVESQEFLFQELIKPYRCKINKKITEITGLTNEDVKDAREMWEVMADFFEFAEDLPLIGYNNKAFDSKFLVRCGRYCHKIIKNDNFDVLIYAKEILDRNSYKLGDVSASLGIDNPRAHRALADAVTTAKVYMKLKELDSKYISL
ncbi:MAG: 3'-5' exonuclease [Firmicutes bacterium]|nr:3'-5' exonuclease [Bacillota bacterium]